VIVIVDGAQAVPHLKIDVQDLSMVLSHWNKNDAPTADFNQDGITNINDLSALLSNFGK
jgi:hypothetical protein